MKVWTVKSVFHNFLLGQVVVTQILFSDKGINSHMAPNQLSCAITTKSCIFLRKKSIYLLRTPPCTTGVTQVLDQSPNKNLHYEYNKIQYELLPSFQTINRKIFITIFGGIWEIWASKDSIIDAAKTVGISNNGFNVNDM